MSAVRRCCLLAAVLLLAGCGSRHHSYELAQAPRHRVQDGDTISSVARMYGVAVRTVIDANDLAYRRLEPGQVLVIPGGTAPAPEDGPGLDPTLFAARATWALDRIALDDVDPMGTTPTRITIHHTGDAADLALDGPSVLRRIERQHRARSWRDEEGRLRHWACIGYHFVIDGSGVIWEGRPLAYQGAHAGGDNNIGNIGIAVAGDFDRQPLDAHVREQLVRLVDALRAAYGIPRDQVCGHDHYKTTQCPGAALFDVVVGYRGGRYDSRWRGDDPAEAHAHAHVPDATAAP